MNEKCELCKGIVELKTVPFNLYGIKLGEYPARVCQKCGDKIFDAKTFNLMEAKAKKLGLYGLTSRATVTRHGNSIAVTIGKRVAEFIKLKKGEHVLLYPEGRERLIVERQ
ncbi:MAG: hypothetical protein AB1571_03480 [Nanoarchaeota archaeon]